MPQSAGMIEIRVIGLPAPQGSKRFVGMKAGRGILIESSKAVKPWREAVKWAAREAMEEGELSIERHCSGALMGAVSLSITFTMPRPKSAKRGAVPSSRPDLSKLVRSTEDALTDAGVWEDDARVVSCESRKTYPGEHTDALNVPGAVIRVAALNVRPTELLAAARDMKADMYGENGNG